MFLHCFKTLFCFIQSSWICKTVILLWYIKPLLCCGSAFNFCFGLRVEPVAARVQGINLGGSSQMVFELWVSTVGTSDVRSELVFGSGRYKVQVETL